MNAVQRKITAALLISTFLAAIEVTIISTAMPQIAASLGGLELISWVFAVYLLTTAVSTPIWGKLADLAGRKAIFLLGVAVFLVGSLLCGFSQSMMMLVAFRAVQGIGAGAIFPVTFAIIADAFNFEQRAKIQGWISSVWGIAGLFGPLAGGFLVDYVSWHWVFFMNIPFGLLSMWMVGKHLVETVEKRKSKIDYFGALTFTVGMAALLYGLLTAGGQMEGQAPQGAAWRVGLFAVAAVFLALFFVIQKKHPEPMMPLSIFRNRNVAVANAASFLTSAILIGLTAYLPLWTQNVLDMGATASGLTLVPQCVGWTLAAMLCANLLRRFRERTVAIWGGAFLIAGSVGMAAITVSTPLWLIAAFIFIGGIGFGLTNTVFTLVIQSSVDVSMRGAAGASNALLRTLGQTIGVAVLGTVLNARLPYSVADGLIAVFVISAFISVASWLLLFWIPKTARREVHASG